MTLSRAVMAVSEVEIDADVSVVSVGEEERGEVVVTRATGVALEMAAAVSTCQLEAHSQCNPCPRHI